MRMRGRIVAFEVIRNAERRMRLRDPDGIAELVRHGLAPQRKLHRAAEISDPFMKDVKPSEQLQLIVKIAKPLSDFETSPEGLTNLPGITPGEHLGQAKGGLQLYFAPACCV